MNNIDKIQEIVNSVNRIKLTFFDDIQRMEFDFLDNDTMLFNLYGTKDYRFCVYSNVKPYLQFNNNRIYFMYHDFFKKKFDIKININVFEK